VLAWKLGADCSLLLSPLNTKLSCWPVVLLIVLLPVELEVELAAEEGRSNIQGTATCLPELLP
jgi:hypothetical protein